MSIVMRAACMLVFVGLGCTPAKPATGDSAKPATGAPAVAAAAEDEALTHLEMYAMDSAMALDHAVLSELAADPSVLLPNTPTALKHLDRLALRRRLEKDGYPVGGRRLAAVLAAFNRTDRSDVKGDDQAVVAGRPGALRYGPTLHLAVPETVGDDAEFNDGKFHWVGSLDNQTPSEGYGPLKIAAGVSACLYAGNSTLNGFVAYWKIPDVSLGCQGTGALDENQLDQATRLSVLRTSPSEVGSGFGEADVPNAGRFELGANMVQMIGVKCGGQWCQIAPPGTVQAALEKMPTVPASMDPEDQRNRRMKGRYDYQMLANKNPDGSLVPSGVLGRVRPVRRGSMENPDGDQTYAVAEVILTPYAANAALPQKYRDMGYALGANTLTFCRGNYDKCGGTLSPKPQPCQNGPKIWGQVIADDGTAGPVFSVCYVASAGGTTPVKEWIVRWQWQPQDDGLWIRCLNGCCTPKL